MITLEPQFHGGPMDGTGPESFQMISYDGCYPEEVLGIGFIRWDTGRMLWVTPRYYRRGNGPDYDFVGYREEPPGYG